MIDELTATVSFCTSVQAIDISESWNAAARTFRVVTKATSAVPGALCSVAMGVNSSSGQVIGYIDAVEYDHKAKLYTVSGRDMMRRAIEYFLVNDENGDPEYATVGVDAGLECQNLLNIAGLALGSTDTLGYVLKAGVPFSVTSVWDAVQSIMAIGQWRAYCSTGGIIYISSNRVTPGTPIAILVDSQYVTELVYSQSSKDTINRVVVTGEEGIYAIAIEPSSPIPWAKTAYIHREFIDSEQLAQDIADLNLSLYSGLTEELQLRVFGYEEVHVGDTVEIVETSPSPVGIEGNWVVFSLDRQMNENGLFSTFVFRR
jgi:hypothetical protein